MAKFPSKPQRGQKALQSIYNTVCDIIDYLPSLTVNGDNKTTSVSHSSAGTVIHAAQPITFKPEVKKGGEGGEYQADNITLQLNGNVFSIKPPMKNGQPDTTGNYALVCLSGTIQWVEMQDC